MYIFENKFVSIPIENIYEMLQIVLLDCKQFETTVANNEFYFKLLALSPCCFSWTISNYFETISNVSEYYGETVWKHLRNAPNSFDRLQTVLNGCCDRWMLFRISDVPVCEYQVSQKLLVHGWSWVSRPFTDRKYSRISQNSLEYFSFLRLWIYLKTCLKCSK